ncbi:MAG: SxtJ family membrane protein, partial [Isosphaeraceae bacterium]
MRWSDIPFSPPIRMLRQFAALWMVFFGGIAAWQGLVRGRVEIALALGTLAIAVGGLGLIWPKSVRPIFVGWMVLAFPIGWTVSLLVLALVFYGLFLPIGLVMRLSGRDALWLRPQPGRSTYWTAKPMPTDVR